MHDARAAMDEKTLTRALRPTPATNRPGWSCPDETQVCAYAEQRLPQADAARVEAHLADCNRCMELVAFLVRRPADSPDCEVPATLLARAADLVVAPTRVPFGRAVRWAGGLAAACLVLAAGIQWTRTPDRALAPEQEAVAPLTEAPAQSTAAPSTAPAPDASPALPAPAPPSGHFSEERKAVAPGPATVVLTSPDENATLRSGAVRFEWEAFSGSLYYEVQVMTDEGTVAWHGRTDATSVRIPNAEVLEPSAKYFVSVRAYLAGGGTVRSSAVSFRIVSN